MMSTYAWMGLALAAGVAIGQAQAAEPLATAGIGLQSCQKLASEMKPAEGLDNTVNALVVYWTQGYMSAANITTLESDEEYVDLGENGPEKIIATVYEFCSKNPDKKPISAIDALLTDAEHLKGTWPKGSIGWAAE